MVACPWSTGDVRERGSSHTVTADLKSDGTRAGESSVMVYLPSEAPCEPASLWFCLPSGVKQQDWTPCPPQDPSCSSWREEHLWGHGAIET